MAGEQHLYLVASGGYASSATALGAEIWQTGIRLLFTVNEPEPIGTLASNEWNVVADNIDRTETDFTITSNWTVEGGVSDFNPGDYLNDQAAPAFDAWMSSNIFSSTVQLRELRLYPISSPDGRVVPAPPYAQGSPALLTWNTAARPVGSAAGSMMPPQNSIVASLRTAQVGKRGRGRMYSPPTPLLTGSGADAGVINASNRGSVATAFQTLIEALAVTVTEPTGSWVRPIVIGAPYVNYAVVNQVRIGSVYDGQSRRRNSILEQYTSLPVEY